MLTIKDFISLLKLKYPEAKFFNSTIDESLSKCIGVYSRTAPLIQAVGEPSSYDILSLSILIHWTEDSALCEDMANSIYQTLKSVSNEKTPEGIRILFIEHVDGRPVWTGRNEKNIAEYVIRSNIYYERGVN